MYTYKYIIILLKTYKIIILYNYNHITGIKKNGKYYYLYFIRSMIRARLGYSSPLPQFKSTLTPPQPIMAEFDPPSLP